MSGHTFDHDLGRRSDGADGRDARDTRDTRDTRDVPSERRGPHALVALASFAALVAGAMCVVALLVTLARAAQGGG